MAVGASAVFGFAYLLAITFSIQVQQQHLGICSRMCRLLSYTRLKLPLISLCTGAISLLCTGAAVPLYKLVQSVVVSRPLEQCNKWYASAALLSNDLKWCP